METRLNEALTTITSLIALTKDDLADIKEAKHDAVFSRSFTKENLAILFEKQKLALDTEITELAAKNSQQEIGDLLTDAEKSLLNDLKNSLIELHALNKRFGTLAIAVGEFYTSLVRAIFPAQDAGYGANYSGAAPSAAAIAHRERAGILKTRG
ncbi:MAG: hypothetical protein LBU73_10190 [Helicobacteraceae bacterium]|jgi:hypothetical protein|nr:hypothetical protein [Helicobacteraceae bacterium]